MIHSLQISGKWYLASSPRRKVHGTLFFEPGEGLRLELAGSLDVIRQHSDLFRTPPNAPIILGIANNGDDITLRNCIAIKWKGNESSVYRIHSAFLGQKFSHDHLIKFNEIRVEFQHLDEWVKLSSFHSEMKHKPRGVRVEYTEQEPIVLYRDEKFSVEVSTTWSVNFTGNEAKIKQQIYAHFKFPEKLHFDDCLVQVRKISQFLTMSFMKLPFPISIEARNKASRANAHWKKQKFTPIYYQPIYEYDERESLRQSPLFSLNDIKERSQEMIGKWLQKHSQLSPVFNLYFANLNRPGNYAENRFLNLAQAIETYHRLIFGGKFQSDEEYLAGLYTSLVNVVPSTLDPDFRRSLVEGRLKYANEYSLRKRLLELTRKLATCFPQDFLNTAEKRNGFVGIVTDTRNYLTHYDDALQVRAAKGLEISLLEYKLRLILEACLLRELDFQPVEIRDFLSRSETYGTIDLLNQQIRSAG